MASITGTNGADLLFGDSGPDTIHGRGGNDTIFGAGGDDRLYGEGGSDTIFGNVGRDLIDGGAGSDMIVGEGGGDTLTGGTGRDVFQLQNYVDSPPGPGADRITDFSHAQHDRIDLQILDANTGTSSLADSFTFIGAAPFTAPGQVRVLFSGSDTIVQANSDRDAAAELEIHLSGHIALARNDFIL